MEHIVWELHELFVLGNIISFTILHCLFKFASHWVLPIIWVFHVTVLWILFIHANGHLSCIVLWYTIPLYIHINIKDILGIKCQYITYMLYTFKNMNTTLSNKSGRMWNLQTYLNIPRWPHYHYKECKKQLSGQCWKPSYLTIKGFLNLYSEFSHFAPLSKFGISWCRGLQFVVGVHPTHRHPRLSTLTIGI